MKSELKHWELALGGQYGSRILDASSATATATGLRVGAINVRKAATFSILTGYTATAATNFLSANVPTSVGVEPGMLFAPYNGYFTNIQITAGQISYYTIRQYD